MYVKKQSKSPQNNTFPLDKIILNKIPDLTKSHRFNGIINGTKNKNLIDDIEKTEKTEKTEKNDLLNSWNISKNTANKSNIEENEEIDLTNYSPHQGKFFIYKDQLNKDKHKQNRIPETKPSIKNKILKKKTSNEVISIEDSNDDKSNNNFNKLSVKPSNYILPHKSIQSIHLNKGNLKQNIPRKIIAGYQTNNTEKLYIYSSFSLGFDLLEF